MPYNVRFTDTDKADLTVFDNTSNNDTSLIFPGRNVVGYGQIIAENFLHLLENFASASAPVSPVEGQLWYDSSEDNLKISPDGFTWKSASGIYKSATQPNLDSSREGEIWIDTTNQQLRIFNGVRWILVGPSQSAIDGLRYGPNIETVDDSDGNRRVIVIFYVADVPVAILSKDSFTPRIAIPGYLTVKSGININNPLTIDEQSQFEGGNLPKLIGKAESAESLVDLSTGILIPASLFLRSDKTNTTEYPFNIRNNTGLTVGIDQNFNVSTGIDGARIYNSTQNSSISFQINRSGIPDTIIKIQDNRVGINNSNPQRELDLTGDFSLTGFVQIGNTNESTNLSNGSLRTAGGVSISKNLRVNTNVILNETQGSITQTRDIRPLLNESHNLGAANRRWNRVYAKELIVDSLEGVLLGNIDGNSKTATSLQFPTNFQLTGDVASTAVTFDGQVGGFVKLFNTVITSNIIASKREPPGGLSRKTDYILTWRPTADAERVSITANNLENGKVYRIESIGTSNFTLVGAPSNTIGTTFIATGPTAGTGVCSTDATFTGLLRQTRDGFIGDAGVPIGCILPYAGLALPVGYLLCDGSEVLRAQYPDLYNIIGNFYNGAAPLLGANTFRLPDLRGRFPLGRDNMDNQTQVPGADGGFVNAGGGAVGRVPEADTIAVSGGTSQQVIQLPNLPEHSHTMQNSSGVQFNAVRNDPALASGATPALGGTASGQAQFLPDSGGIKKINPSTIFGQPMNVMNPFLSINYIIRSGPPAFTVT
jgi:microcystin-dependent protein